MSIQVRNPEMVDLLSADFINCWIPIEQQVIGAGGVASVVFDEIPPDYRALCLQCLARTNASQVEEDRIAMRFNNDSVVGNYGWIEAEENCNVGTTMSCNRNASYIRIAHVESGVSLGNVFTTFNIWCHQYRNTNVFKVAFSSLHGALGNWTSNADFHLTHARGCWRNTAAITRIDLLPVAGNLFVEHSSFILYGIL